MEQKVASVSLRNRRDSAPPKGQTNLPPSAGMQFFGEVEIDGRSGEMAVTLRDATGAALHRQAIAPVR